MAARLMGYVSASNTPTVLQSFSYGTATGGIGSPTAVTINSINYQYLQFNATGTLTVTTAGWFDYCLIGGGNGSIHWTQAGVGNSGGGSGVVLVGSVYLSANCTITIGAGSGIVIFNAESNKATSSSIGAPSPFAITAGGAVGTITFNPPYRGVSYQRLGGGYGSINQASSNTTTNNDYGFLGGNSNANDSAGGGGGNTGAGQNPVTTTGGAGGAGFDVSAFIGGSTLVKATGGGGGGSGAGGAGGSSNACTNNGSATSTPQSAAANTGAGGGGGFGTTQTTGAGGSGICYIRFGV